MLGCALYSRLQKHSTKGNILALIGCFIFEGQCLSIRLIDMQVLTSGYVVYKSSSARKPMKTCHRALYFQTLVSYTIEDRCICNYVCVFACLFVIAGTFARCKTTS